MVSIENMMMMSSPALLSSCSLSKTGVYRWLPMEVVGDDAWVVDEYLLGSVSSKGIRVSRCLISDSHSGFLFKNSFSSYCSLPDIHQHKWSFCRPCENSGTTVMAPNARCLSLSLINFTYHSLIFVIFYY